MLFGKMENDLSKIYIKKAYFRSLVFCLGFLLVHVVKFKLKLTKETLKVGINLS